MLAYWGMSAIPVLGWFVSHKTKSVKREHLIDVFFLILILLLALRAETVGVDLSNYKFFFTYAKANNWTVIFAGQVEPLYWALNYIVTRFTESYRIFLVICALFSLIPMWMLYRKEAEIPLLSIAIFMVIAPLPMYFSGIRQAIAIASAPIAYELVKKRKIVKFFIVVAIATGIHMSAFILVLMYPLYYAKLNRSKIIPLILGMLLIYSGRGYLYSTAVSFAGGKWLELYGTATVETGAYKALLLLIVLVIYCYLVPDEVQLEREVSGLRNFLLLCLLIQMFAPISYMVMRLGYYYHIFIPLLIPKIAMRSRVNRRIAQASIPAMTLFFIAYFFYRAYSGATGLHMFPYVPFWRAGGSSV